MFVVTSSYQQPREEMEALLSAHADWLNEHHEAGIFISSGCNIERTGGSILAHGIERLQLEQILAKSPFARAGAAIYRIVEMAPPADSYREAE